MHKQHTHRHAYFTSDKSNLSNIAYNIDGVTGNLKDGVWPIVFFIPRNVHTTMNEVRGDGKSKDLCSREIMFRYCFIELYCKLRANSTQYNDTYWGWAGIIGTPITLQKALYDFR